MEEDEDEGEDEEAAFSCNIPDSVHECTAVLLASRKRLLAGASNVRSPPNFLPSLVSWNALLGDTSTELSVSLEPLFDDDEDESS